MLALWQCFEGLSGGGATVVGTAIGWLLGLVALVLGALFNSHLTRLRDDRLRAGEIASAAVAISAELQMMEETLQRNANTLEKRKNMDEDVFFAVPDI